MSTPKADIINRLRKDFLCLPGHKISRAEEGILGGLGILNEAFPDSVFPIGAVHEFLCTSREEVAATDGFISAVLGMLMKNDGVSVWISPCRMLFPPALKSFGIDPDKIIFIQLTKEQDILWTMEEALKCNGLASVVCEVQELSFTASRRFQLAVEQSRVTGFIIRVNPRKVNTTACVTRWKISSLASEKSDLPGVGYPGWNVELLKVRNGKLGSWQLIWAAGKFRYGSKVEAIQFEERKKTG